MNISRKILRGLHPLIIIRWLEVDFYQVWQKAGLLSHNQGGVGRPYFRFILLGLVLATLSGHRRGQGGEEGVGSPQKGGTGITNHTNSHLKENCNLFYIIQILSIYN